MLIAFKNFNNANKTKISTNVFLTKWIAEALKSAPKLNSSCRFNNKFAYGKVIFNEKIDVNSPIVLPDGSMMTVRLNDVGNKNLLQISRDINLITSLITKIDIHKELMRAANQNALDDIRQGKLLKTIGRGLGTTIDRLKIKHSNTSSFAGENFPKDAFTKGTITISNIGGLAKNLNVSLTLLDIISPQTSVIGINPIVTKIKNGVARKEICLTCAFDHRVIDFGDTIPFIEKLKYFTNHSDNLTIGC